MTKTQLTRATDACIEQTREALQTLLDNINQGQRKQLSKREEITTLLEQYGVEIEN